MLKRFTSRAVAAAIVAGMAAPALAQPLPWPGEYGDWRQLGARSFDDAAARCAGAVDRERRVERIDAVERDADGWRVRGTAYDGARFVCTIDRAGRPRVFADAGAAPGYPGDDWREPGGADYPDARGGQWDDDRYAAERARIEGMAPAPTPGADWRDDGAGYPRGPEEEGLPPPEGYGDGYGNDEAGDDEPYSDDE